MSLVNFVKSSRLFLYLGFGIIFLAIVCLPARVRVVVQPEVGETILFPVGIIYGPLIGFWSFPTLVLGIVECSFSKKAVLSRLTLILSLANGGLAFAIWFVFFSSANPWWLILALFGTPCLIANIFGFLYYTKKDKLIEALKNPKIRVPSLGILMVVPLLFAAMLFYMWLATVFY